MIRSKYPWSFRLSFSASPDRGHLELPYASSCNAEEPSTDRVLAGTGRKGLDCEAIPHTEIQEEPLR